MLKLTKKEKAVFNCIGEGMQAREIAEKLNLRPQTIQTYRYRILSKMGLSSTTEIVKHWILKKAYDVIGAIYEKGGCGDSDQYLNLKELREILSIKD